MPPDEVAKVLAFDGEGLAGVGGDRRRADGSAVAVAEHVPVHLGPQSTHIGAFVGGGEVLGLAVERFDFLGDREVFVGDGLVGDAGIDHRHCQGLVTEECGDCFETHASVDRLGGEGVAKLVWGHVADPGPGGDAAERVGNTQLGDGSAVLEQEPFAS